MTRKNPAQIRGFLITFPPELACPGQLPRRLRVMPRSVEMGGPTFRPVTPGGRSTIPKLGVCSGVSGGKQ